MSLVELGEPRTAAEMRDRYRAAHHRLYHTRPRPKVIAIHDHTPASQPLSVVVVPAVVAPAEVVLEPVAELAPIEAEPAPRRLITVAHILNVVSAVYGVSVFRLKGEQRTKDIVRPRHIAMYLAKVLTGFSYPRIAQSIGDRDHSTGVHACQKIARLMESDAELRQEIEALRLRIEESA